MAKTAVKMWYTVRSGISDTYSIHLVNCDNIEIQIMWGIPNKQKAQNIANSLSKALWAEQEYLWSNTDDEIKEGQ